MDLHFSILAKLNFFGFKEILYLSVDTPELILSNINYPTKDKVVKFFKNDMEQSLFEMLFLMGKKILKNTLRILKP